MGGAPGYIFVTGTNTLAFPSLGGNGMFRSLGNLAVSPGVRMLCIDFGQPKRLRVNGCTSISFDDPLMARFPGADLIVHVEAEATFPNCPRYIHQSAELSPCLDRGDGQTKVPVWETFAQFADALPRRGQKEPGDG